ncbi:hypothetical protein [Staphylococcus xylosus]|uniref:hypothetical protein n=1 Tax=Staphylococcus xylosus TaxID=1288 RepID=UPI0004942D4F|nr:hypothetical protein [Staphylococcus xylosus]
MNNSRLNVSSVSRQSLVYLTSNNPERKSEAKAKKASQTWGVMRVAFNLKSEIPCWYKNNGYTTHDVSFQ